MKIPYNYIVIEGCIGAGKTTFAKMIAEEFNAEMVLEQFADNPFLPKFYEDPVHYALPVEMHFLMERYQQLSRLLTARDMFKDFVVGDYFIDKCIIFSKNNLLPDEFKLYSTVFDTISSFLPKPDLIVYLYNEPEILLKHIAQRGRSYEQNITAEYLSNIQESYLNYFKRNTNIPVVLVQTSSMDFVKSHNDYLAIRELLEQPFGNGLHRVSFNQERGL